MLVKRPRLEPAHVSVSNKMVSGANTSVAKDATYDTLPGEGLGL